MGPQATREGVDQAEELLLEERRMAGMERRGGSSYQHRVRHQRLKVTLGGSEDYLSIRNNGREPLLSLFVLSVQGDQGKFIRVDQLAGEEDRRASRRPPVVSRAGYARRGRSDPTGCSSLR